MSISFSAIFFRLLNTAALFALLAYIFKRFFFDSIKRAIAQKELAREALIEREKQLAKNAQIAIGSLKDQKLQADELFQKVSQWQQRVMHDRENERDEQQADRQKLMIRAQRQKELIEQTTLKRMVARPSVDQARTQLQSMFGTPQAGHSYLNQLVQEIAKRNA